MREIEMCNSDLRWPRLIVPWRCALCFYLRWGDKGEWGWGGGRKREAGEERERDGQQCGERERGGMQTKRKQARRITRAQIRTHPREGVRPKIDHWWVSPVVALIRKSMRAHQWYLTVESAHAAGEKHSGDMCWHNSLGLQLMIIFINN